MRWFKHMVNSHNDESLAVVIDRFGLEGYGFWWLILEIIGEKVDEHDTCSATFSIKKWTNLVGTSRQRFNKLVSFLQDGDNFPGKKPLLFADEKDGLLTLSCPNILKYRDEWTRKKSRSPEKLRRNSGATPGRLRSKETDTDTDTENILSSSSLTNVREDDSSPATAGRPDSGGSDGEDQATQNPTKNRVLDDEHGDKKTDNCPHQKIIDLYHEILPELPSVRVWNEKRRRMLRARWKEDPERQDLAWWEQYFHRVRDQPFLLGHNGNGWRANLPWLLGPEKMARVLEGFYADKEVDDYPYRYVN